MSLMEREIPPWQPLYVGPRKEGCTEVKCDEPLAWAGSANGNHSKYVIGKLLVICCTESAIAADLHVLRVKSSGFYFVISVVRNLYANRDFRKRVMKFKFPLREMDSEFER